MIIESWLEEIIGRVVRRELARQSETDDRLLTADEVAQMLHYKDRHAVYKLKREKKLRAVNLGVRTLRFSKAEVQRFINERAV